MTGLSCPPALRDTFHMCMAWYCAESADKHQSTN